MLSLSFVYIQPQNLFKPTCISSDTSWLWTIQYKPTNVNAAFSPERAPDFSSANDLNREQYSRNMARFQQLQNFNDQTNIRESARAGEDLILLGQFGEKALKIGTEIIDAIQKENEINDMQLPDRRWYCRQRS